MMVSLSSTIEAYAANYIVGREDSDSYTEFLEKCEKLGGQRLADAYNLASIRPAQE